jgi:hypothetical protein
MRNRGKWENLGKSASKFAILRSLAYPASETQFARIIIPEVRQLVSTGIKALLL